MKSERVVLMTMEEESALVVSFAIEEGEPGFVISLILQRSPQFESFLPADERGVLVSHERLSRGDDEYLVGIRFEAGCCEVESTGRRYALDITRVDADELDLARRVLERMNFDDCFSLAWS